RVQPLPQVPQQLLREPGADSASVAQAVALVRAHQERAQPAARARRLREAADHELLVAHALHLQPVPAPPGLVRRIRALGDDALETVPAGLLMEGRTVAHHVVAVTERA